MDDGTREAVIQTAYMELAIEHSLTVEAVGSNRARVPAHWRDAAEAKAQPYLDLIEQAITHDRSKIAGAIHSLAHAMREGEDGWDEDWSTREVRDALGFAANIATLGGDE